MNKQDKIDEEYTNLLYELVIRQSAMEKALLKAQILTEKNLAEAQIECMEKLKLVIENQAKITEIETEGFIKYGEKNSENGIKC